MSRFCAVVGAAAPLAELASIGADAVHRCGGLALGLLTAERPGRGAGPYRTEGLTAVGEVWLPGEVDRGLADAAGAGDLLARYRRGGAAALVGVDGSWAFALADGERLVVGRDPLGGRSVFWAARDGITMVSSSLRALARWPRLRPELDPEAVVAYLTFAYVPGPLTLLRGVHGLEPGRVRTFGTVRTERRGIAGGSARTADVELGGWLPQGRTFEAGELARPPSSGAAAAAARDLRGHLEVAVRRRMPSSGAVAVLLSGGIDSSLVTALAARTPGATVATYSIGFGDHLPNELGYAGLVASHCATAHHEVRFDGYEVAAGLAAAVRQLDNPVGDPLTVPNALLDERIAADGHRVVLNGEGGDPVFGGPKNLPMIGWELTRIDPSPGARADAYLASYRKLWGHLDQLLTPAFAARLEGSPGPGRWVEPHLHDAAASAYLDRLLLTNLRTKGANHIQHKVERLSAAAGIEARAPLFDLDVVTAAFRMHPALKLAGTVEKAVLKDAVRDLLPVTIVDRPKSGMRVPVQAWLAGPLRAAARELLVGERALDRGLFRPEPIRAWLDGGAMVWPRQGLAVWMLLTLELWLRWFLDGDAEVDVDLGPPPRRRRFPTANRGARGLG